LRGRPFRAAAGDVGATVIGPEAIGAFESQLKEIPPPYRQGGAYDGPGFADYRTDEETVTRRYVDKKTWR